MSPGARGYQDVLHGVTYISHNVTNFEFLYEPFYVSKDTAPVHDERFVGYGYTRNTQVRSANLPIWSDLDLKVNIKQERGSWQTDLRQISKNYRATENMNTVLQNSLLTIY